MSDSSLSLDRAAALGRASAAHCAAGVVAFALLTAVGAAVRIPLPFTPVPVTLQTLFVLLAGVYLGGRGAVASQGLYLVLGAAGLPVFAGGSGVGHLLGPTGGFLLAFPVAAWVVGASLRPGDRPIRAVTVFVAATALIFGLGATWLAFVMDVSAARAVELAVLPFLPGAALKIAAAAALVVRAPILR